MASIEERLQALEQTNTELKQKIDLHTIALGGLVNKATLEAINEKNDKIFQALTSHDQFTNLQLAELREKVEIQIEGKIVGMQTEMRQRFDKVDERFDKVDERFEKIEVTLTQILEFLSKNS